VYQGSFGEAEAERLLWRAGFGPTPGQARQVASLGLEGAIRSLTRPSGDAQLVGPEPSDGGQPLAPADVRGHDVLWWLDRMVRSTQPLLERMTLVWHDWFATSLVGVNSQRLMLDQNTLFRSNALGNFHELLLGVTADPAMLVWLSGVRNTVRSPNENYGRELMELFTLGHNRGYTETDVREQARSLTGFRASYARGTGPYDFRFDPLFHDGGSKTIFGKNGNFDWHDSVSLCLANQNHASYFVSKLWSYFVPTPPDHATATALQSMYAQSYEVRPLVEAILRHPALHTGPRMVKPPVVYTAGMLRALGRPVDTRLWAQIGVLTGQRLFVPPNVAGWDETRWLDTSTFRGRWLAATLASQQLALASPPAGKGDAASIVSRAVAFWHTRLFAQTGTTLVAFAKRTLSSGSPAMVENAVRQLVAVSPDYQTA
jgi:uncharacterized protein (DUF1800 family)